MRMRVARNSKPTEPRKRNASTADRHCRQTANSLNSLQVAPSFNPQLTVKGSSLWINFTVRVWDQFVCLCVSLLACILALLCQHVCWKLARASSAPVCFIRAVHILCPPSVTITRACHIWYQHCLTLQQTEQAETLCPPNIWTSNPYRAVNTLRLGY
jgi:hypothetical protein